MSKIKPLLILFFNSSVLSGGNRRIFELLRLGQSEGVNYIILTDLKSCKNANKMFPGYLNLLSNYKVYLTSFKEEHAAAPFLKQFFVIRNTLQLALSIFRVALLENADLIVGGEDLQTLVVSYLSGKFSGKPWTVIFQPTTDLLQPSYSGYPVNALNILKFVNSKPSSRNLSLYSRIGISSGLLLELKIAEKSLILPVSRSVIEEVKSLNPKIKFHLINPGNGVKQTDFFKRLSIGFEYDGIFFARLIPIKGLFELPTIWQRVVKEFPRARLAVAGIVENQIYVKDFLDLVKAKNLSSNIIFLGELDDVSLRKSVSSSKLALYPSYVDSFSLVTLESIACGVPVVAYNIPAISWNFGSCEAVLRCKIGDNFEMAEKAIMILKNDNLRAKLSEKAQQYSANYNWRDVLRAEKNAYFEVVKSFRSSPLNEES